MAERLRLGQLLVEAGILMPEELEVVLLRQKKDGRKLGSLLVDAGLVNETQLTQILSQQLNAPWVSLYHIDFSRQLLNLVPRELVEQYCLVPIYVRHVRGQGETLYVAMDDPSNDEALSAVKDASGLPVRAMIAPPSDIRNAIRVYYLGGRASQPAIEAAQELKSEPRIMVPGQMGAGDLPPPRETLESEPIPLVQKPAESVPPPAAPAGVEVAELPEPAIDRPLRMASVPAPPPIRQELRSIPVAFDDEGPQVAPENLPAPKVEGTKVNLPQMFSLTLLDGTTISLPRARKKRVKAQEPKAKEAEPADEELSETDVVSEDGVDNMFL